MLIGVVSVTHDNVDAVKEAASVFDDAGVDAVVHCGDFIAPPVIPFLEGFEVHGVLGNNDGEVQGLNAAFENLGNGSELHGRFADLEFGGAEFAVLHGEDPDEVRGLAGNYDYVLHGHFHVKEVEEVDGTTLINPGGQFPTVPDEHRTVAVVDTDGDVEFVSLV